jgi:Sad1 / UNC-like C-terminal
MLSPCEAEEKWIIVELCEEIGVSSIQLANYELFSSNFRDFGVFVSDSWSESEDEEAQNAAWTFVGNFTAANRRELQLFEFDVEPADFVKVEFYSHFGNEFYCPLSVIEVHGSNLVQELKGESGMSPP